VSRCCLGTGARVGNNLASLIVAGMAPDEAAEIEEAEIISCDILCKIDERMGILIAASSASIAPLTRSFMMSTILTITFLADLRSDPIARIFPRTCSGVRV